MQKLKLGFDVCSLKDKGTNPGIMYQALLNLHFLLQTEIKDLRMIQIQRVSHNSTFLPGIDLLY